MKEPDPEKLMNHLIGQVIKKLKAQHPGRCIEPTLIRKILEEVLDEEYQKREKEKSCNKPLTGE